jgi:hypothetical protein
VSIEIVFESLVNNRIRGGCMTGLIDAISGAGVSG